MAYNKSRNQEPKNNQTLHKQGKCYKALK